MFLSQGVFFLRRRSRVWGEMRLGVKKKKGCEANSTLAFQVFQCLIIEGENAGEGALREAERFVISDEEFKAFLDRHREVSCLVPESNQKVGMASAVHPPRHLPPVLPRALRGAPWGGVGGGLRAGVRRWPCALQL